MAKENPKIINFVETGDETSASHRFRAIKPYEVLTKLGHTVTIRKFPRLDADVNVFQKHFLQDQVLDWMKKVPTKIIFDVCDDHFDRKHGKFYFSAVSNANLITCTNKRMEKRLKELFPDSKVFVYYDPINSLQSDSTKSFSPTKAIWFGHSTNLEDARPWLEEALKIGLDLTAHTNIPVQGDVPFQYIPFTPGWMEENLKNYNLVLLPTGNQPWVNMKSENRFVDALNAGCLVITNNNTLYGDLVAYGIYETGSLKSGLEQIVKKNLDVPTLVKLGQDYVRRTYNDEVIKEQWKTILNQLF